MRGIADSSDSDGEIVTPRYWGGFAMPMGQEDSMAICYPALSQIWIDAELPDHAREIALLHEGMHVFTMCCQVPQLLALQAELFGTLRSLPDARHFRELVELACITYFLVHTGLEITPRYLVETNPRRHQLGVKLIEIAERIAPRATRKISPEKAVAEALAGLCMLIMHIIPYRTNLGHTVLRMIDSLPTPEYWENRWQVFSYFYAQLQKVRIESPQKLRQFDLNAPPDVHRDMADLCMIMAKTIGCVTTRPFAVTATFPTLLMVLTMRCFRFAPILYLHTSECPPHVNIDVDHVTRRSLRDMKESISIQQGNYDQSVQSNRPCWAAHLFINIAEKTKPFITSIAKSRSFSCFESILDNLPSLLHKVMNSKRICYQCEAWRKTPTFVWAYNAIVTMPKEIRTELLEAAGDYESWLRTGGMEIIRGKRKLSGMPQPVMKYPFL